MTLVNRSRRVLTATAILAGLASLQFAWAADEHDEHHPHEEAHPTQQHPAPPNGAGAQNPGAPATGAQHPAAPAAAGAQHPAAPASAPAEQHAQPQSGRPNAGEHAAEHQGGRPVPQAHPEIHDQFHHFDAHDHEHWHGGHWFQANHFGRDGWWWIVGDDWYWYPAPIYPYPDPYVPGGMSQDAYAAPVSYYCPNPDGYYPYVPQCAAEWIPVATDNGFATLAQGTMLAGFTGHPSAAYLDGGDINAARQAEQSALTAPLGQGVPWSNPQTGHTGVVAPVRDVPGYGGGLCRDFRLAIQINGQTDEVIGSACRQPNGYWAPVAR